MTMDNDRLILGVTAFSHNASFSLVRGNELLFSSQLERYTRIKNDPGCIDKNLDDKLEYYMGCVETLKDELSSYGKPDQIVFYEKPWLKKLRQLKAKQIELFDPLPKTQLKNLLGDYVKDIPIKYVRHHLSHAGDVWFAPERFRENDCAILVIDAIGEFDTATLWKFNSKTQSVNLVKVLKSYPESLGLFYSAFTKYIGMKPNEEEYIMMGLSSFGTYSRKLISIISAYENYHSGVHNKAIEEWIKNFDNYYNNIDLGKYEIESHISQAVQVIFEDELYRLAEEAKKLTNSNYLVYSGGSAMNSKANFMLFDLFEDVWIHPDPSDSGCSMGAIASYLSKPIKWNFTPFYGHNINREYPIEAVLNELIDGSGICGIANGRAEFGQRALGNRSLLANPLIPNIKDRVNEIKKREFFRPFAHAILDYQVGDHFYIPTKMKESPYMQYCLKCKDTKTYSAVCHVDESARIQTVSKEMYPNFYNLLQEFFIRTGCPMLLNTSLNIRGEPIVNSVYDVSIAGLTTGVKIF